MVVSRLFAKRGCLFLLVFLLLLGAIYVLWRQKEAKTVPYVVYTAFFEVTEKEASSFSVGDILTDARGKEDAGVILATEIYAAEREDAYGTYSLPDKQVLVITLGGEGKRTDSGVRMGTITPRVGEPLDLFGKAKISGICLRVRAV